MDNKRIQMFIEAGTATVNEYILPKLFRKVYKSVIIITLLNSIFYSGYSRDVDTSCKYDFYRHAVDLSDRISNHVCYKYLDSSLRTRYFICEGAWLYRKINRNVFMKKIDFGNMMVRNLMLDSPLSSRVVGKIYPDYEIRNRKFINKWKRKGAKKFTKYFFKKNYIKTEYGFGNKHFYEIIVTAFEMGILISPVEEAFRITYANCSVVR